MTDETTKVVLKQISDDVRTIKYLLTGNGESHKGLVVRVDRLEQTEKRRGWTMKATLGAMIVAAVAAVAKAMGWGP